MRKNERGGEGLRERGGCESLVRMGEWENGEGFRERERERERHDNF